MSLVTGEVVPNPGGKKPFKIVFRHSDGGAVIAEEEVDSQAQGEREIIRLLRSLGKIAREEATTKEP